MRQVGVSTWDELYQFSIRDVEKFTEEVLKFLDIKFDPPYDKLLNTSDGIEFPKWFTRNSPQRRRDAESESPAVAGGFLSEPGAVATGDVSYAGLNITTMCLDRWQTDEMKDQPAIIWEGEEGAHWFDTYEDIFNKVEFCAAGMRYSGIGKGDAVAIHMPMMPETVVALLAINRIGAIAVPVFSGYGVEAIVSRIQAVGAKALFTCDGSFRRGKSFDMFNIAKDAADKCRTIEKVFVRGRLGKDLVFPDDRYIDWFRLLDLEFETPQGEWKDLHFAEPTSAEDPLIILYTSGTTGKPKGIAHTHASFPIKAAQDMAFGMDVGTGTRICWYTDLGWMMGPWLIYGALINGATICLYDGAPDYPTPDRMWEFCARHKVEFLGISPTLVRSLAAHEETQCSPPYEGGVAAASADGVVLSERRTLTVATTRPETMLGDTAVAVNPNDERYKDLIGQTIELPLTNREIPIIADEYVESEFGTGAVKITPAHDPNDWEIGERHNLEKLVVMNDDATMNANAGPEFDGLDRLEARARVIEKFEELGLLEKIEDYDITLPHCERCKTVIEPLLSEQWFVKMDQMRDMALDLMREKDLPHFYPEVPHKKVYTTWLENLKDWTISRQLWWGHQIPAWYDQQGNVYVARTAEQAYEQAGTNELRQDPDVLDTWFSSALWAFSTLGWTGQEVGSRQSAGGGGLDLLTATGQLPTDLQTFYPTDVLITGRDIIFLWVSRMVMTGLKFIGERPFDDVVVTGTVLDKNGQRMSKTKGNGIDPLEVFEKFGVDATRMTLAGSATGVDFAWRDERVESFRNFANKIWNATRFCLLNSEGASVDISSIAGGNATVRERAIALEEQAAVGTEPPSSVLSLADRWIISKLNRTAKAVNHALETYQFHEAVQLLYHFFWDDFCDWYIELVKDEITGGNATVRERASKLENDNETEAAGASSPPYEGGVAAASADGVVLSDAAAQNNKAIARTRIITVLEQALRMLHPFMPYLTEELWQKLPAVSNWLNAEPYRSAGASIMLTAYPTGDDALIDERAETEMSLVIELISKVRNIRQEMNIKPSERVTVHVAAAADTQRIFAENEAQILKLARLSEIILAESLEVPRASAKTVLTGGAEVAIPLEGLIDFDKERERLQNQLTKLDTELQRLNGQLSNQNFVERAPQEKVQELRDRKAEIEQQSNALNSNLEALA
jgi:valyl-tRNA synthetase